DFPSAVKAATVFMGSRARRGYSFITGQPEKPRVSLRMNSPAASPPPPDTGCPRTTSVCPYRSASPESPQEALCLEPRECLISPSTTYENRHINHVTR